MRRAGQSADLTSTVSSLKALQLAVALFGGHSGPSVPSFVMEPAASRSAKAGQSTKLVAGASSSMSLQLAVALFGGHGAPLALSFVTEPATSRSARASEMKG